MEALKKKNRLVLAHIAGVALFVFILVFIIYYAVVDAYDMPIEYANNLATCKGKPSFTYKASPFILLLTAYTSFPIAVFIGLRYRWEYKRGWSSPLIDNYSTGKYYAFKWLCTFVAGIVTLAIPFLFAVIATMFGKIPLMVTLFFVWIPICLLNGFVFACGLHTYITR